MDVVVVGAYMKTRLEDSLTHVSISASVCVSLI